MTSSTSEEVPNAARLGIMRVQKNLGHTSKELLGRALRIGGASKIALRAARELKSATFVWGTNLQICLQS